MTRRLETVTLTPLMFLKVARYDRPLSSFGQKNNDCTCSSKKHSFSMHILKNKALAVQRQTMLDKKIQRTRPQFLLIWQE